MSSAHEDDQEEDLESYDDAESGQASDKESDDPPPPPVYEQLGAPALVYRHKRCQEDETAAPPWAAIGGSGTWGHVPPDVQAKLIHRSLHHVHRAQARWYYPMEYHVVQPAIVEEQTIAKAWEQYDEERARRRSKKKKEKVDKQAKRREKKRKRTSLDVAQQPSKKVGGDTAELVDQWNQANPDPLSGRDDHLGRPEKSFLQSRVFHLTNEARANMLRAGLFEDDNDREFHGHHPGMDTRYPYGIESAMERQRERHHDRIVRSYNSYDHAYFCGRLRAPTKNGSVARAAWHLAPRRLARAQFFAQQRTDCADPAYLAPFPIQGLEDVLREDLPKWSCRRRKPQTITLDDPNHPKLYGNCLACVPCPCPPCSSIMMQQQHQHQQRASNDNEDEDGSTDQVDDDGQCSWCLLHPVGKLLDTLTVSSLHLPQSKDHNEAFLKTKRNVAIRNHRSGGLIRNERKMGETIRQIVSCGASINNKHLVIVRTSIHVTILALQPIQDDSLRPNERATKASLADEQWKDEPPTRCWGTYHVHELQRIDLRSFSSRPEISSFVPVDVAHHPQYGRTCFTSRMKMAVLSYSNRRAGQGGRSSDRNVVHHFLLSLPSCTEVGTAGQPTGSHHCTKHVISNLLYISAIEFTTTHPMILWAVAKAYVTPALTPDLNVGMGILRPRVGLGSALFTIDLRTNKATFEWSPSAEEFLSEGIHSLSGLAVDWKSSGKNNRLWVSSVSAGKVWELDGRTPCRVINMWSLPGQCDDGGPTLPETGLYGAGTILVQPTEQLPISQSDQLPLFSVGMATDTFGLCLYQQPQVPPRFETHALECAASPELSAFLHRSEDSHIRCSVITSAVFALPDVSDEVFTCGLASIRVPIRQVLTSDQISTMGCDPSLKVVCALTMTNKGDLYTHMLLESPAGDGRLEYRRQSFPGLPVGSMMISVPPLRSSNDESAGDQESGGQQGRSPLSHRENDEKAMIKNKLAGGMNLCVRLTNQMPPSGASAASRENTGKSAYSKGTAVRPFQYADLRFLPRFQDNGSEDGDEDGDAHDEHNVDQRAVGAKRSPADIMIRRQRYDQRDQSEETITLPAKFRGYATNALASVLDCFDHDRTAAVERADNKRPLRSDMTKDILDAANSDWEED